MFDLKNIDSTKLIAQAKPIGIAAACLTVVFITGFGAGKMHSDVSNSEAPAKRSLSNYNTNSSVQQPNSQAKPTANTQAKPTTTAENAPQNDCPVKGSKSKIYHIVGGSFYERTNAAQCFATEAEAQAAGYTKSSR